VGLRAGLNPAEYRQSIARNRTLAIQTGVRRYARRVLLPLVLIRYEQN
jgi:hypothetical protein